MKSARTSMPPPPRAVGSVMRQAWGRVLRWEWEPKAVISLHSACCSCCFSLSSDKMFSNENRTRKEVNEGKDRGKDTDGKGGLDWLSYLWEYVGFIMSSVPDSVKSLGQHPGYGRCTTDCIPTPVPAQIFYLLEGKILGLNCNDTSITTVCDARISYRWCSNSWLLHIWSSSMLTHLGKQWAMDPRFGHLQLRGITGASSCLLALDWPSHAHSNYLGSVSGWKICLSL